MSSSLAAVDSLADTVAQLQKAGCPQVFVPRRGQYDLTDGTAVRQMFADAERMRGNLSEFIILHIAGMSGGIAANKARPADFYYQNVMMNALVFDMAVQFGANKLIALVLGLATP